MHGSFSEDAQEDVIKKMEKSTTQAEYSTANWVRNRNDNTKWKMQQPTLPLLFTVFDEREKKKIRASAGSRSTARKEPALDRLLLSDYQQPSQADDTCFLLHLFVWIN